MPSRLHVHLAPKGLITTFQHIHTILGSEVLSLIFVQAEQPPTLARSIAKDTPQASPPLGKPTCRLLVVSSS